MSVAAFAEKAVGFMSSLIPVPRWLESVRNLLGLVALAVIILGLIGMVALGLLSGTERIVLVLCALAGIFLMVIFVLGLAARSGTDFLYNPFEKSLAEGTRYGIEQAPVSKVRAARRKSEPLPSPERTPLGLGSGDPLIEGTKEISG